MKTAIASNSILRSPAESLREALARSPRNGVVFAGTVAALMSVVAAELLTPPMASLGALVFIPVALAGWLLPPRTAGVVVGLAIVVRCIGILNGVHPVTALAETVMVVTIGAGAVLAADRFRQWNHVQIRLQAQAAELAAAAERERIAQDLTRSVIHTVFAVTLDLHSALGLVEQEAARQRIQSANKKLDEQITNLRSVVFKPAAPDGLVGHPPAASP